MQRGAGMRQDAGFDTINFLDAFKKADKRQRGAGLFIAMLRPSLRFFGKKVTKRAAKTVPKRVAKKAAKKAATGALTAGMSWTMQKALDRI